MTELRPYPKYHDSDVAWLGDIPAHWERAHGSAVLQQKKVSNRGMVESTVLSLSYGRIVIKPPEKLHGLVPESFETYQVVDPGDIIIRPTDLQNDWTTIRVGLAQDRGIITSAYLCFRTREPLSAEYAHLLLLGYDLKKVFYGMGSGLRQNLDWSDFKRMPILLPPTDEQQAIVRFVRDLDKKINRFIRNRRRLIEVLNEHKQAIINRAVTRGLNPNAPLKPSGIEWLGDIPAHWEAKRGKYLFREIDSRSMTGDETHLSMSQRHGLIPSAQITERRLMSESYIGGKLCEQDDLVLNRLKAHLGVFALAPEPGIVSPDYTVFRARCSLCPKFYEYFYRTPLCRVELRKRAKGIVQGFWRLYTDDFYDIPVPVPPVDEQTAIVELLGDQLAQINSAIEREYREIDLIREYRTRLIADVVTGKVDVRHLAPASGDESAEVEPEALDEGIDDEEMPGDDEPELVEETGDSDD